MIEIREYLDAEGSCPYGRWIDGLNAQAAAKVAIAVTRMAQGNLSNTKGVGASVTECRIDFGLSDGSDQRFQRDDPGARGARSPI